MKRDGFTVLEVWDGKVFDLAKLVATRQIDVDHAIEILAAGVLACETTCPDLTIRQEANQGFVPAMVALGHTPADAEILRTHLSDMFASAAESFAKAGLDIGGHDWPDMPD